MSLITKQRDLIKTTVMVAPQGKMSKADLQSYGVNFIKFVAPTLAIFFAQLALGVDYRAAALVALFALYQSASDFFSKLSDGPKVKE